MNDKIESNLRSSEDRAPDYESGIVVGSTPTGDIWCTWGEHLVSKEDFYFRPNGKRQSGCKECNRKYRKKHYLNNKEYYIKKARKSEKVFNDWYLSLKYNKPCTKCGHIGHPKAMHWHHKFGNKEFCISEGKQRGYGRIKILREIEKCELLCADCHAETT